MIIEFNGLNVKKKSTDCFRFELEDEFNRFYITFENIYLAKYKEKSIETVLIFDYNVKHFIPLNPDLKNKVLAVAADTNHFWCLVKNGIDNQDLFLTQYNGNLIVNEFDLNKIKPIDFNNLLIIATDINCYLFENNLNETKCKFELKNDLNLKPKQIQQAINLNENSTSSLSIDKVLFSEPIKQICSGKEHVLILTNKNLYSFGIGTKV